MSEQLLKERGKEIYIDIKQLRVILKWSKNIDLDLMAFFKTKDGRGGGVFSPNIPGGHYGRLNSYPYIQLSEDAGSKREAGEKEEDLRITKLDMMEEVNICALNYTDAIQKKSTSFNEYDGRLVVINDRGETVTIPLNTTEKGHVAIIAKIDNTASTGAKLINENKIVDLDTFTSSIPGANLLVT